ncbi:MAG: carboxypeptidase-like regulatory domain-containing protein [Balneolaceae bacterium]
MNKSVIGYKIVVSTIVMYCLLFLISGVANAQRGTISGFVFDAETSEPMPHANIIVEGTSAGTYTAGDGSYSIKLDTGLVEIRYKFLSYRDTVIQFNLGLDQQIQQDVYLQPDLMSMDVTVSANRVARKVQELARIRDQQNSNLQSYKADVYKVAILSNVEEDFSYENIEEEKLNPIAFSERKSKITYSASPERYSEVLEAHRASKNFFSEFDFFSTGGAPLNLNSDEITLSILSESITVVGPISDRAGEFYELYDEPADSSWAEGTIEIYFDPKVENRPLFEGQVWYDEEKSVILGMDVTLNEYAETNTGTFKISDLRYEQSYEKVGDFWLPEKTELSAMLLFITSKEQIYYHDEWSWDNFKINTKNIEPEDVELSTINILADAHDRNSVFWDTLSNKQKNENSMLLEEAKNYEEDRTAVRVGMSAMRKFFRLPYQMERFYLTNFSDIYHYNRVEGHYLGLGLRTPVHPDYEYRAIGGYGFANKSYSYELSGYHFLGKSFLAPEISYHKETLAQYQDYEYNRTPIDFFETRQTILALTTGSTGNNYFEREGLEAGLRFRFNSDSFLRVLYMDEIHRSLTARSDFSLFGNEIPPEDFLNNHPDFPAQEGEIKGLYVHLHHDNRQYSRTQFLRDYNIRKFGWMADAVLEKGIESWNSDFDYNRYRLGLKFYWPVFSSHFFQTDIIVGASNSEIPNQRLFTYNGYVVDDYVRYRPFNTVSYREPLGNRISEIRIRYKFGSSLTRSLPIEFISKSGIQISTLLTVGVIDQNSSLEPLLPYSGSQTQAELSIAASKILGVFYTEFSKKLYGSYGSSMGLKVLF